MASNLNHHPTPTNSLRLSETELPLAPRPYRRYWRLALIGLLVVLTFFIVNILLTNLVFTGLPVGTNAPFFHGVTLDGQAIDLAQERGQPVMLTFWSPDCFACREELPALQALADDPNVEMQLVTVVSHLEPTVVAEFVEQQQLTFPILVDPAGTIAEQYEVSGIPFTYLIDQNGVIDEKVMGAGQEGELQNQLGLWLNSCRIDEVCAVE
ncbi:MAG: redoxin domain-containing protein [Caldilineaceae bacterium]|nr:redoxin domain-containing protein [Caldilineaceae bacterium]